MTRFYRFILKSLGWIMYAFFFMKVENKDNIPKTGNYIILSNHVSAWDPFTIAVSGKFRFRPMAKKELYRNRFVAFLLKKVGSIKVDRTDGAQALAYARKALERKETMLIFPEGTRSRTRELLDFKAGAFALAIKTRTPVLPCQVILKKRMSLFCGVRVRFGNLLQPEELEFEEGNSNYERSMELIRSKFLELRRDDMP